MSADAESGSFDLFAASLRAELGDVNVFLESLAAKLEEALPNNVRVERARAGMFGPKQVRRLMVDVGDEHLQLARDARQHLQAQRGRVSGGIVIKSEALEIDSWIEVLSRTLAAEAGRNEKTRQALERLLMA